MKKTILISFFSAFLCCFINISTTAQIYQIPNSNFESWDNVGSENVEPVNFNSFMTGSCSGLTCMGKEQHLNRDAGCGLCSGSYSVKIWSTNPIGSIIANGNITLGKINLGSTTATDASNYNSTILGDSDFSQEITGTPDSLYFWTKFIPASNNNTDCARINAVIHGNVAFRDPAYQSDLSKFYAQAVLNYTKTNSAWVQKKIPFDYKGTGSGTLSNGNRYILISMSTNETPGGGSNKDYVWFDDIVLIYSAWLNDIKISGTTLSGFQKGCLEYNWPQLARGTVNFPFETSAVTYTKEVNDATVTITNVPGPKGTVDGGYTLIKSVAEDGVTIKEYKIYYDVYKSSDNYITTINYSIDNENTTLSVPDITNSNTTYSITLDPDVPATPVITSIILADTGARITNTVQPTSVNSTATITVKAENGSYRNYSIVYSKAQSSNTKLSSLKLNNIALESFSNTTFSYNYPLSECSVLAPTVTATAESNWSQITLKQSPNNSGSASVIVKAENQDSAIYTINFSNANNNAYLTQLKINGQSITGFSSTTYQYDVVLPYGTNTTPVITYTTSCLLSTVSPITVIYPGTTEIEVTAGDGNTKQTYQIHFTIALNNNPNLKSISYSYNGNIYNIQGFNTLVTTYNINLGTGPNETPILSCEKQDTNASVKYEQPISRKSQGRIIVTAEDSITVKTYNINFNYTLSSNANLSRISCNGNDIANFAANTTVYNITLPHGTDEVPEIKGFAEDSNAKVNITDATTIPGYTQIQVLAEDSTTLKTYKINFTLSLSSNTNLSALSYKLNNQDSVIADFITADTVYNITLSPCLSANLNLIFTKEDNSANAVQTPSLATTYDFSTQKSIQRQIKITAANGLHTKTYTVNFTVSLASNANLSWIKCNGISIPNFHADSLEYNYELPYGTTEIPTMTCAPEWISLSPQITAPLSTSGTTSIKITAEDGTERTYKIHLSVAQNSNNQLSSLNYSIDNGLHKVVIPLTTDTVYNIVLNPGTIVTPIVYYTTQDANAIAIIDQADSVNGTARIMVTAENGNIRNYILNFEVPSSNNPNLAILKYNQITVQGFNPSMLTYTVELAYGTTIVPTIEATAVSSNANINILQAATLNDTATVTVTAGDGITQKIYKIAYTVALNNNADLSSISYIINSQTIEIQKFDPYLTQYFVQLPAETKNAPKLNGVLADAHAQKLITDIDTTTGVSNIKVIAENGITQKIYEVTFSKILSSDATLSALNIENVLIDNFNSEVLSYTVTLPYGTTQIPTITATASCSEANVFITQAANVDGQAGILVNAENSKNTKTYLIDFIIAPSNISSLSDIQYQIGDNYYNILNFESSNTDYQVALAPGTKKVPAISVTTTDANADIDIIQPDSTKDDAIITVTAPDGYTQTIYRIHFSVSLSKDATLASISVNDMILGEYTPNQYDYSITLPYTDITLPIVTVVANYTDAHFQIRQAASYNDSSVITVLAEDQTTSHSYTLHFTRILSPITDMDSIRYQYGQTDYSIVAQNIVEITIELPAETEYIPIINNLKLKDFRAQYKILKQPSTTEDTAIIKIIAEDSTEKQILIHFERQLSSNTHLKSISYNHILIENFNFDTLIYNVILPWNETNIPEITAVAEWKNAHIQYTKANQIYGTAQIRVISETSLNEKTYIINFLRGGSPKLTSLSYTFNGQIYNLDNFSPDTTDYYITFPKASIGIPTLNYTLEDNRTTVAKIELQTTTGQAQLILTTWDNIQAQYNIHFSIDLSTNPQLSGIFTDDSLLSDFNSMLSNYIYMAPFGTDTFPVITATAIEPDARIEIIPATDYGDTAIITCYAGDTSYYKVYKVLMLLDSGNNARLSLIKYDDINIAGFNSNIYNYTINLYMGTTAIPTISAIPEDKRAIIDIEQAIDFADTTIIKVTAYNSTTILYYYISFKFEPSPNARLSAIMVNGEAIPNFKPNLKTYTVELSDNNLPIVTAIAQNQNATVEIYNINSLDEDAIITVLAEDGITSSIYRIKFTNIVNTNAVKEEKQIVNQIYPNPVNHILYIKGIAQEVQKIEICDMYGRLINALFLSDISESITIDVSNLTNGSYFLNIYTSNSKTTHKLIKQ